MPALKQSSCSGRRWFSSSSGSRFSSSTSQGFILNLDSTVLGCLLCLPKFHEQTLNLAGADSLVRGDVNLFTVKC